MLARGWPTARVILVMLAVVTAACEPEGLARLELIEEGGIAYPNSTALANGGYEAELTLEGPQPAAVWSIYGTDAPAAEVIQFYADELRALGWEEATGSRRLPRSEPTAGAAMTLRCGLASRMWRSGTSESRGAMPTPLRTRSA